MGFAIKSQHLAIGIDHGERVVIGIVGGLEERDRQHDFEFTGEILHPRNGRMILGRLREVEQLGQLVLAEIGCLEQFLELDDSGAALGGLPHQGFGPVDILGGVRRTGELSCRNSHRSHG